MLLELPVDNVENIIRTVKNTAYTVDNLVGSVYKL